MHIFLHTVYEPTKTQSDSRMSSGQYRKLKLQFLSGFGLWFMTEYLASRQCPESSPSLFMTLLYIMIVKMMTHILQSPKACLLVIC